MFPVDIPSAAAVKPAYPVGGTPGFYTDCDPTNDSTGTVMTAAWLNRVQSELLALVTGLGGAPDPADDHQIADLLIAKLATFSSGRLLRLRKFTTSGTLVKASDLLPATKRVNIWLYSASGGSGGVRGFASSMPVGGSGGAGGASMKSFLVAALLASESYVIGAKGLAGSPTADGAAGGASSFGTAPYFSVSGGNGGRSIISHVPGTADSAGGVGSGGDINLRGQSGDPGWVDAAVDAIATISQGAGSPGPYGGFGPPGRTTTTAANGVSPDANSAAGPTGANATYNTAASTATGADGSAGFMIIEEYEG